MYRDVSRSILAKLPLAGSIAMGRPSPARTLVARNKQGERRVSPAQYKLLLTLHIAISGGWLGVVVAKLVLGLTAMLSNTPDIAAALFLAMDAVNIAFPPLAVGAVVTGVLLSLGTKWGLLQHYWIVTKLVLTVGVIVTAVQIGGRLARPTLTAPFGPATDGGAILGLAAAPTLLIALAVTHLLMLGAATVISVYKPWGKTWFGQRKRAQRSLRDGQQ